MVIKPYGYAIWEKYTKGLDGMIRNQEQKTHISHFHSLSFLSREADHVKLCQKCAIVTHHRLKETADEKGVELILILIGRRINS